jgi:DMSO/TMAO reductase YedYZ heme-binding membrane subunit
VAIESELDLVSAILIFFAAIVPGYLSLKLKGRTRRLTIALTAFIAIHGIYHIVRMQGLHSVADNIFEPISIMALIAFGITYVSVSRKSEAAKI